MPRTEQGVGERGEEGGKVDVEKKGVKALGRIVGSRIRERQTLMLKEMRKLGLYEEKDGRTGM